MSQKRLQQFWPYLRPFRGHLAVLFGATLASSLVTLPIPWCEKIIVDDAIGERDTRLLFVMTAAIIGLFVLLRLLVYFRKYLSIRVKQRVLTRVRVHIYEHLQQMSLAFFARHPTGSLLSRLTNDVSQVQHLLNDELFEVAAMAVRAVVVVGLLWSISPWLTGMCAGVIPPIVLIFLVFKGRVYRESRALQASLARLSGRIQENFAGMKLIQAEAMEASAREETLAASRELETVAVRQEVVASTGNLATTILSYGPLLAILWGAGGTLVIRGELSLGSLLAFTQYLMGLINPAARFFRFTLDLQAGYAAIDRIREILDQQPDIQERPDAKPLDHHIERIEFDHVSLLLGDSNTPVPVLEDVSLSIRRGERVALVGPNGAGKSSILHLLLRFHDPSRGSVRINGIPLPAYQLQSVRRRIAYAPQDTFLFGTTVRHNVALFRPVSNQEISRALETATAMDFVATLEGGLDAPIEPGGSNLSGGERQRLGLARALIKDADLYLLDEPTSALDARSERQVLRNLADFLQGRTALIIAHRFSFLQLVDRIVVLNQGRVVESGTMDELLERRGLFAALHRAQTR